MNNGKIKISIIVPVFNVEKQIQKCLDSILNQSMNTGGQIEVILVDDGSTDESGKICDGYSDNFSIFRVFHRENAGAAAARNMGLENAKGEYVAFVDPDDYIELDYCEQAYTNAKETDADIVIFDAVREENQRNSKSFKSIDWGHADKGFSTQDVNDITNLRCRILYPYYKASIKECRFRDNITLSAPWDKLYKRDFLVKNGISFPEHLKVLDDMCFNFMVFAKVKKISYIKAVLYHYVIWSDSITNSFRKDRPQQDQKVFEYIKKEIESETLTAKQRSALYQAYYARVIKSFAICCRLYFFNSKNPNSPQKRIQDIRNCMETYPYKDAFYNVRLQTLEWKLWLVTLAGRMKMPRIMYLLHVLQNGRIK